MEWIGWLIVNVLLMIAVYTDVKERKIKNKLIAAGIIFGLLTAWGNGGMRGLLDSVKAAGIMLAVLFFLFIIKGIGAGDIKLFCVLAIFFPGRAVSIVAASFFTAGVLAMGKMFLRWIRNETAFIKHETMNFSIPIMVGTEIVLALKYIQGL